MCDVNVCECQGGGHGSGGVVVVRTRSLSFMGAVRSVGRAQERKDRGVGGEGVLPLFTHRRPGVYRLKVTTMWSRSRAVLSGSSAMLRLDCGQAGAKAPPNNTRRLQQQQGQQQQQRPKQRTPDAPSAP